MTGKPAGSVPWYDENAELVADLYESVDTADLLRWATPWLPDAPARILDIGAGTGRDAAWFSRKGHKVTAAEPARGMRRVARRKHPGPGVEWVDDQLPGMATVRKNGTLYDLVLLNAMWVHVPVAARDAAMSSVIGLLAQDGTALFTVAKGALSAERGMVESPAGELARLATTHGGMVVAECVEPDRVMRLGREWMCVAIRRESPSLQRRPEIPSTPVLAESCLPTAA